MKALDIALKDFKQSFRSLAALVFMFVVPLLITGMFFLIFGDVGEGEENFSIAKIPVVVANLDTGGEFGNQLVESLQGEYISNLMDINLVEDSENARQLVDQQKAAVALVIPENFSNTVTGTEASAEIELYQDPTLTLGPSIVNLILTQYMDGYSGSRIAIGLSVDSILASGSTVTEENINQVVTRYVDRIETSGGTHDLVIVENPSGEEADTAFNATSFIGFILGGMMIFYSFFTGANSAMSILHEEERGTLPRLFTTPTAPATILNGKFIATAGTIAIQVTILLFFGWLIFDIHWGSPLLLIFIIPAITASAAGFGIFINSFLKDTKQAGMVFGGVVTITGMLGMSNIFVMGAPGASQVVNQLALLVPQGWAMRALQTSMDGADLWTILPYVGVSLIWAAAFFLIGNTRFKRRYL